jgi:PKHD-type hydroxylase
VGQFYGWHQDVYENLPNGLQRKISVVIPLVDSNEYEGGDLQFYNPMENPNKSQEDKIIKLEKLRIKGSAIIFPSYIYHQVTPVTKGERLSIVIWFNGEKWK